MKIQKKEERKGRKRKKKEREGGQRSSQLKLGQVKTTSDCGSNSGIDNSNSDSDNNSDRVFSYTVRTQSRTYM